MNAGSGQPLTRAFLGELVFCSYFLPLPWGGMEYELRKGLGSGLFETLLYTALTDTIADNPTTKRILRR